MAQSELEAAEGRIEVAEGAYQQALDELETPSELRQRNPDTVPQRQIEQLQVAVDGRQGALNEAHANKRSIERRISSVLPAQMATAQAELEEAEVELAKTTVYAGERHRCGSPPLSAICKEASPMSAVFGLMSFGLAILIAPAGAVEPMSASQVAQALGFDGAAEQKLLAGGIVTAEREETTAKQLAVSIGMLVKGEPDALAAAVLDGQTLEATPAVLGFGKIDPESPAADLDGIAYTADEVDEVSKLLEAEVGDEFNLSADELAALREATAQYDPSQAGDPAVIQAVNEAYRTTLLGRLQAYLAQGLAGIAPYQRDGEVSDPAEDLRAAAEASQLLQQAASDMYRGLVDFPEHQPADVQQAFFWIKEIANDRPVFSLNHRMVQRRPDGLILLSRTFYAGHSFNASLSGAGVFPVQDGNAVFYTNRTASDQVAGFMQGTRHEVGRGMMRDALIESFEAIRAQLGGG